ncbi:MAG TPA: glycosyltransferase family 4 protein [Allosphingosinicella sp.]|nr:glycosyltransferase family 4 protein [Allosphingosinicella sp.]
MKILFVTWDGPQVNYLQSLFLPIFERLAEHGVRVDVLQFRWGPEAQAEEIAALCARAGCGYRHSTIRRGLAGLGPFATAVAGGREVRRAVRDFGSDVIMPRSHMPAIAAGAAGGSRFRPLLFDADGFPADEKVEFGALSASGPTYHILRRVEAWAARSAGSVIVRSAAAARILAERAGIGPERFHVVVNGRDGSVFHPHDERARLAVRSELGIAPAAPLAVYAGSVGPQYRFDLIRDFAAALARLRPDARLLVLSGSPELAQAELGEAAPLAPIVIRASPAGVGRYLAAADIGLAFRARSFSVQGVAPVKLGEYLLCGVPVVGNSAVGDTGEALEAGVFLDDGAGPEAAAAWLVGEVLADREAYRSRARAVGVSGFSLQRSVEDYLAAIAPLRDGRGEMKA